MKTQMSKYLATLLILGAVTAIAVHLKEAKTIAQASGDQPPALPFLNYLSEMGKDDDLFFTIEEAWSADQPADSLTNHWLLRSSKKQPLHQELEQIRQTIPNFTYEINQSNPRIIHIMDVRLVQQKGYGLNGVIDRIDFTGNVNDLPSTIAKHGLPIAPTVFEAIGETRDHSTVVKVKGGGLKVRDALTDFVPLEGRRGRILWMAKTKIGEDQISYIRYP